MVVEQFGCETIHPTHLHTKVYLNGFIANALRDNIGMTIFDLGGCGGL